MEEDLVTQIGLLLNQLRYARRALEDIERSTAKYGGVTFAVALAAGPKFGEPPLLNGALKVHITNINELAVGRGALGFFEGILGGIGRFFGGLGGGFVGGIIGGVALWVWVGKLQEIVKGIADILDRLGITGGAAPAAAGAGDKAKPAESGWAAMLKNLNPIIESLTALFNAASSGPKEAGKMAAEAGTSDEALKWGEQLAKMLTAATATLDALDKIIKGLTVFVPILIGALATLLVRLADIKLAILDLLQFAFRVVLLLRGAALITIYDTVSAVAKLGAGIMEILKTAFMTILESVLAMIGSIFDALEAFIKFIGSGLQKAMNALLTWLVEGLGRVLTYIGDLRIFRLLTHLVEVLPNLLPAIAKVAGVELTQTDIDWLGEVKGKNVPGPTGAALTGKLPKEVLMTNVGDKFLEDVKPFKDALKKTGELLPDKTGKAFDAAQTGFTAIDKKMTDALTKGETGFDTKLKDDLKGVVTRTDEMAKTLAPAMKTAEDLAKKGEVDAGLRTIAKAYEDWMKGDGLKSVLAQISTYFGTANAAQAPAGAAALPSGAVGTAQPEVPKATVEIGEIVIELKAAKGEGEKPAVGKKVSFLGGDSPFGYDEDALRAGATA